MTCTLTPGKIVFLWNLGDLWGYVQLNIHQLDDSRITGPELDSLYPRMGQGRRGKDPSWLNTCFSVLSGHFLLLKKDGPPSVQIL